MIWELIISNLDTIITGIIGLIVASGFGIKYRQVINAGKVIFDALDDDKITDKEMKEIIESLRDLFKKKKK